MSKNLKEEDCPKNRNTSIEEIELSTHNNQDQEVPAAIKGKIAAFISTNKQPVLLHKIFKTAIYNATS